MVPGSEQKRGNTFGDCFSKKESLKVLSGACEGSDAPVVALQKGVEHLYTGPGMLGASARRRQSEALSKSIMGFSHGDDNVGRVSNHTKLSLVDNLGTLH